VEHSDPTSEIKQKRPKLMAAVTGTGQEELPTTPAAMMLNKCSIYSFRSLPCSFWREDPLGHWVHWRVATGQVSLLTLRFL